MPRREFASIKALQDYAAKNRKLYVWEGTSRYADHQRQLSPDQCEIVDVLHSQGVRRAMVFPKAVLKAEWEADAPL